MFRVIFAAFLLFGLTSCATVTQEQAVKDAFSLTKDHFSNSVTIKDDALDVNATITTLNGYRAPRNYFLDSWSDNFIRAFVNKKTGAVTYQVYQIIHYRSPSWRFYNLANYETKTSPRQTSVTVIDRDVDCTGSSSRYSGCSYTEHIGFDVDEDLMKSIAASYVEGVQVVWRFKLGSKSGVEHQDGFMLSEIAGIVGAVEKYRRSSNVYEKKVY